VFYQYIIHILNLLEEVSLVIRIPQYRGFSSALHSSYRGDVFFVVVETKFVNCHHSTSPLDILKQFSSFLNAAFVSNTHFNIILPLCPCLQIDLIPIQIGHTISTEQVGITLTHYRLFCKVSGSIIAGITSYFYARFSWSSSFCSDD
jgi:hypothetical protein